MSQATDTFVRFVDAVAELIDDPDATGVTIAGRAHLSRFHFDRVVAAIAGESPAAFRRRILLERAAYRLSSSRNGVLDVAVEGGYGSHEAFTRAFARAYGVTPSQWRRGPSRSFWLEAPSGVHFHPAGGLRVPARTKVTTMDLLQSIVAHHVWVIGQIVDRIDRLDAQTLDEPITISVEYIDDEPTLRSAVSRLIGQLQMWNTVVAGDRYDFAVETHESVSSMRTRLADAGRAFTALVTTLTEEGRLDESFVDAQCEPPEVFTYGGMLAHVLAFGATRRTIVIGALHKAGITDLGAGDPMGWLSAQQR
ncbi:MAG: helix-turn-helix transcriptional regulator [Nocardioidaceae bacterium]